jgi:hypothetical protein
MFRAEEGGSYRRRSARFAWIPAVTGEDSAAAPVGIRGRLPLGFGWKIIVSVRRLGYEMESGFWPNSTWKNQMGRANTDLEHSEV